MTSLLCLSEIEEPILIHSNLTGHGRLTNSMYCVLIKNYFILFKRPTDVISVKRLPITNKVQLQCTNEANQFSIVISEFIFTFSNQDVQLIKSWVEKIGFLIENYEISKLDIQFNHTQVKIDQIENSDIDLYIFIRFGEYQLYIYKNLAEHRYDISTHVINLKFYQIQDNKRDSTSRRQSVSSRSIKLIGSSVRFKIIFENVLLVENWKKIFTEAHSMSFTGNGNEILKDIYSNESNMYCADCGYANPEWVSINLCVTVCLDCAGVHRSLGTSYSRIQSATIDQSIWENSYLVEIIKRIGNEKSNSFWYKNKPSHFTTLTDKALFIKDKYLTKKFIDKEFIHLSENKFKDRLKLSVTTDDVFLTYRLWNSINFDYDSDFVDLLLMNAKSSKQWLQEQFLSLQLNLSNMNSQNLIIGEKVLQIAYNNEKKLNDLFLVSLSNNCISIKIEKSSVTPIELINVCCIYYDNINLVWYDQNFENLVLSISPCYFNKFINRKSLDNCRKISVHRLSFFNESNHILKEFKFDLLKVLMPNHCFTLTDKSNIFMNLDVRINDNITKCKCHVEGHEINFYFPIIAAYDLNKSEKCVLMNDNKTIQIKFRTEQLDLITTDSENQIIIYNNLNSVNCNILVKPIEKMISFICYRGLKSEGIFRIEGRTRKVDDLFQLIEKFPNDFYIDPVSYNVNDVASCLKRYFRSLDEPIVTNNLFELFRKASKSENFNTKINQLEFAVSCLPEINYNVFRKIMELLFMIHLLADDNKMTSMNLAISTALSFISFDIGNIEDANLIMKELIDNFKILFEYSEREMEILKKILKDPVPLFQSIIRNFYIHSHLNHMLLIKKFVNEKLNFMERDIRYLVIQINLDKCVIVKQVCEQIFNNFNVEFWHFLTKRSGLSYKTVKRLICLNENAQNSIIYPRIILNYDSYFIFLTIQPTFITAVKPAVTAEFKCEVMLKLERYQLFSLIMNYPNSLQFYSKNKPSEPIYKFSLSDINLYRFHEKNINKVFILFEDSGIIRCKFGSIAILREFLYFYDQFKMNIL